MTESNTESSSNMNDSIDSSAAMPPPPPQQPHVPLSPARHPPLSPYSNGRQIIPGINGAPLSPRLRSRSMDQQIGALSPIAANKLPRSVPVSPVTGKRLTGFSQQQGGDLSFPPDPSEKQKAMEAAVATERLRARELEKEELHMNADELRAVLKKERRRASKIAADLAVFRMTAVEMQSEAEVVEESRINGLMRRLEDMQQEKGRIILDLEREEEMLTNTLQKQLNEVRREKSLLQQQIDREKRSNSSLQNHLGSLKENNLGMAGVPEEEGEEGEY